MNIEFFSEYLCLRFYLDHFFLKKKTTRAATGSNIRYSSKADGPVTFLPRKATSGNIIIQPSNSVDILN